MRRTCLRGLNRQGTFDTSPQRQQGSPMSRNFSCSSLARRANVNTVDQQDTKKPALLGKTGWWSDVVETKNYFCAIRSVDSTKGLLRTTPRAGSNLLTLLDWLTHGLQSGCGVGTCGCRNCVRNRLL